MTFIQSNQTTVENQKVVDPPSNLSNNVKTNSITFYPQHPEDHIMFSDPDFTIQQLIKIVPKEYLVRSYWHSFSYVIWDLTLVSIMIYMANQIFYQRQIPSYITTFLWPVYWIVQGTLMTGIWVLAHECGHGGFSPNTNFNDTVGLILHSTLLVPYWSWKHSHAIHHSYTNHMTKDEVHVPNYYHEVQHTLPWGMRRLIFSLFKHLVLGWPAYLLANVSSGAEYVNHISHFWPWSPLFPPKLRPFVMASNLSILLWITILIILGQQFGAMRIFLLYFPCYLVTNAWLVLITKLQHTDENLPHYSDHSFSWMKGQLSTIDRSFGWVLDNVLHHIHDTHIIHHLFPKIPHYHAVKVTDILKDKLGPRYRRNEKNVFTQTIDVFKHCIFVAESQQSGIWCFHNDAKKT